MLPVPPVTSGHSSPQRRAARRDDKTAFERELDTTAEEPVGMPASLPRVSLQLQEMLSEVEQDKPNAKQILVDEHLMDRRLSSRRTTNRKTGRRASDRT